MKQKRTRSSGARLAPASRQRKAAPSDKTAAARPLDSVTDTPTAFAAVSVAGIAGVIAFVVYLVTAARSLPTGDSGDLITAAWVLGVAHPPGFPLYTMLGHAFGLLPIGSVAFRLNLLSAVLHATTVGLTALCTFRLITFDQQDTGLSQPGASGQPVQTRSAAVGAVVGAFLLAFSRPFWHYSLVAEVFALNSLFAALLLLLLFEWEERPARRTVFFAFSLACGLAATNHPTIVFLTPAFVVLLWSGMRRARIASRSRRRQAVGLSVRDLFLAGILLVVGLLPYLYLPLAARRDPPYNWGDPRTMAGMIQHILRKEYGTLSLAAGGVRGSPAEHIGLLTASLTDGFTFVGWLLFGAGFWWLMRTRRSRAIALLLAFVFTGPVFVAYASPALNDPIWIGIIRRFYILPSIPLAIAVGVGASWFLMASQRLASRHRRAARLAAPVLALSLMALTAASAALHFSSVDQRNNTVAHDYGTDVLGSLEPRALLFMSGDKVTFPVSYLQLVEGYRADVIAVDLADLSRPAYVEQLRRKHPDLAVPFKAHVDVRTLIALFDSNIGSRGVYMTFAPAEPEFWSRFELVRAGLVERVLPKGLGNDRYTLLREKAAVFSHMRYPSQTFPTTSYEYRMGHDYGALAFDVGYVLNNDDEKAAMYRIAIRLAPDLPLPYKNLGVVLLRNHRQKSEALSLWEHYLSMSPGDQGAAAMRREIDSIRAAPQ